jgi:hypothetical protein
MDAKWNSFKNVFLLFEPIRPRLSSKFQKVIKSANMTSKFFNMGIKNAQFDADSESIAKKVIKEKVKL